MSVAPGHAVADCGLKALGMDHGNPSHRRRHRPVLLRRARDVRPRRAGAVGDRIRVVAAHVDPTIAIHEAAWLVRATSVLDSWPIDLRGWG